MTLFTLVFAAHAQRVQKFVARIDMRVHKLTRVSDGRIHG
jgi:hypothetical protein